MIDEIIRVIVDNIHGGATVSSRRFESITFDIIRDKNLFDTDSFGLLAAVISCTASLLFIFCVRSLVDQGHTIKAESIHVRERTNTNARSS